MVSTAVIRLRDLPFRDTPEKQKHTKLGGTSHDSKLAPGGA
jgi:hypothetical protein